MLVPDSETKEASASNTLSESDYASADEVVPGEVGESESGDSNVITPRGSPRNVVPFVPRASFADVEEIPAGQLYQIVPTQYRPTEEVQRDKLLDIEQRISSIHASVVNWTTTRSGGDSNLPDAEKKKTEGLHYFSEFSDDYRLPPVVSKADGTVVVPPIKTRSVRDPTKPNCDVAADETGGLACVDKKVVKTLRSVAKEVVKEIGRKLLSGSFNLTKVCFPIRCMQPTSSLQTIAMSCSYHPIYLGHAAHIDDAIERLKLVTCSYLAALHVTSDFIKPVNPILGETYQAMMKDGTRIYCEQTSHHPPIANWQIIPLDGAYSFWGCSIFSASAGLNTLTLVNSGYRGVDFADGHRVTITVLPKDVWTGVMMGNVCKHETVGPMRVDDSLGNVLTFTIGGKNSRGRPSDCIKGELMNASGKVVSQMSGTWLGYVDFDDKRYWDIREVPCYSLEDTPQLLEPRMPSDATHRVDLKLLQTGDFKAAQREKTVLEDLQRHYAKLRKTSPTPTSPSRVDGSPTSSTKSPPKNKN
eukprot:Platyproteum_vivax@DN5239_c0_g1_i2.p1